MTKSRNFKALATAQAWLTRQGYSKTEREHVWAKGDALAYVALVLGGYHSSVNVVVDQAVAVPAQIAA